MARVPLGPYTLLPVVVGGGPRYGALVGGMYWAMLFLLAVVYACTLIGYSVPLSGSAHEALKTLHSAFGMGILGLFGLRLLIRLIDNEPPMPPPMVQWQARATKGLQWALYLFMLFMPLGGWLILNASGLSPTFYGLELPVLVAPDKEWVGTLKIVHAFGAMLGYLLVGLNILALLYWHCRPGDRLPPARAPLSLR